MPHPYKKRQKASSKPKKTTGIPEWKRGILDPLVEEKLLAAADPEAERPAIWIMMNCGLHPNNLITLTESSFQHDSSGWWLQFKRAKNARSRRDLLPDDIATSLIAWLARPDRPRTRQGVWKLVRRVGEHAGFEANRISPMSLRHTTCIHLLRKFRQHPDRLKLVAIKMGCDEEIVAQNYVDMEEWEMQTWAKNEVTAKKEDVPHVQ